MASDQLLRSYQPVQATTTCKMLSVE